MKFTFFCLMPYAALDLQARAQARTGWVTYSNRHYNREHGRQLYRDYIELYRLADQLGFDAVGVNEHHQTVYGMMPSPIVIASILARETTHAKIAILGSALPLREHPLTLAEEHAMIDTISGGRLVSGFVRGIGAEYHAFGANPALSHERFHEAHDLIIKAWTSDGPFEWAGKHYHFNYVNIWPKPLQQPHPPIWIPSQGSSETIEFAAHPDRRYVYCQTFSPTTVVGKFLDMYREQAARYGYTATDDQLCWSGMVYVAETDAQALREAKAHYENFRQHFLYMPAPMLFPPGYSSVASMERIMKAKGAVMQSGATIEEANELGLILCGSPATVRARLEQAHKQIGFGHFGVSLQFGTMPVAQAAECMRLFAREVMQPLQSLPAKVA